MNINWRVVREAWSGETLYCSNTFEENNNPRINRNVGRCEYGPVGWRSHIPKFKNKVTFSCHLTAPPYFLFTFSFSPDWSHETHLSVFLWNQLELLYGLCSTKACSACLTFHLEKCLGQLKVLTGISVCSLCERSSVITTVVYVPVNTATVAVISVLFDQLLLMTLQQATEWRRLWVATCLFLLHICMKDFCIAVAFLEIISVYFPVQKHLRPLGKQNLQNRRSFTMWILAGFFHVCFVSSVSFYVANERHLNWCKLEAWKVFMIGSSIK